MRNKRFITAVIVSIYLLSTVSCCFAEGVATVLAGATAFGAAATGGAFGNAGAGSSGSSAGSGMGRALPQDAAAINGMLMQGKTMGSEGDTSTKAEDPTQTQQNQDALNLDPTSTEPTTDIVNEAVPDDTKGATKDSVETFATRSTSIDPREALGSTMYDNLRGRLARFGSDFFAKARRNNLTFAPVGANYVVAPGDQVKLTVWGFNEIRANLVVDRDGMLALPQAGMVEAAGLTFDALRQNIETAYKRILTDFELDVSMGKLHTINVYVAGCANRPGAYAVSSMATLMDVLSEAGGPSIQGTMRNIQIKRGNRTVAVFDVYRLLIHGDRKGDARLCDGDIIFIPPVGNLVAAAGNVKRPAIYEVGANATLEDVIRLAGGLTSGATKARIQIIRVQDNTVRTAFESGLDDKAKKLKVADGDLIKFFAVYGGSTNVRIAGAVVQQGVFAIEEGKTTFKEILAHAGGPLYTASDDAELTRVAVSPNGPVTTRTSISIKDVLSGKGDFKLQRDDYIFIRSVPDWDIYRSAQTGGRVVYPGHYAIKRGETLYSLLKRSGGYGENAFVKGAVFMRNSVRADQQKAIDDMVRRLRRDLEAAANEAISTSTTTKDKDFALAEITQKQRLLETLKDTKATGRLIVHLPENLENLKGSAYDIRLEEGDMLFIPEHPNTVQVVGAVTAQAAYVFEKGKTVRDYVQQSGGFAPSASARRGYIIHPDGTITKAFDGNKAAVVGEGDFIVIPEKMVFSPRLRNASDVLDLLSKTVLSIASVHYIFK